MTKRSAAYIEGLLKEAAGKKKKKEKDSQPKSLTRSDIDKARLNPDLMRRMRMRSSVAVPLKGDELLQVRRLARRNLPLMRQRNPKLTEKALYDRLVALIQSRRPEMRKKLLAAVATEYGT